MVSVTDWSNPKFLEAANIPEDLTAPLVDAGIGYLNRQVQCLIDRMADRLEAIGAVPAHDVRVRTDYVMFDDFFDSTIGKQAGRALRAGGADQRDINALPEVVRDRNYFVHIFPRRHDKSGKLDPKDVMRLKKAILTVRRITNRLEGALNRVRAETGGPDSPEYQRMVRVIDSSVPKSGRPITLEELSHKVQKEFPSTPVRAVLGVTLQKYLKDSRRYNFTGVGNDAKVSRRD